MSPTAAASATQSSCRYARRATQKTTTPMTSSHGAQARSSSGPSAIPRRSRVARKDWLAEPSLGPSRVGSDSAPPQKAKEACGRTNHAASETKVAVPTAQPLRASAC